MLIGLIGVGVICLLYYIFMLLIGMDFSIIWLLGAIVCIGGGVGGKYICSRGIALPIPMKVIGGIVITVGVLLFIGVEGLIISQMNSVGKPGLDYVIVLGAQVRGSVPSRALHSRIKKAAEYLTEYPETKAVLSGGQGTGEEISEARVMYDYLTDMGIAEGRLLIEDASTSTLENLMFSEKLIGKKHKVGIVSQNFHIYRATRLAEHMGYEDVCGIASRSEAKYLPHYMVREFFAVVKEKLTGKI